ncbi:MAG TPA: hypothetical protein VMT28_10980 [Terriglobales bacterium]|jgi:FtsH-binding integral membrane protein|nr:hypothetical protein [Terriglobales bacterium]
MPFPESLETHFANDGGGNNSNKDLFDAVWEMVKECGEEERHFNTLQSTYRGVASTWILASLGAVGYLLYGTDGSPYQPRMATIVCLLGSAGVLSLWRLDLQVYHKLLVAVFEEGWKLERSFEWLPRFRTNMHNIDRKRLSDRDHVGTKLAWFYFVAALFLALAGLYLACTAMRYHGDPWYRWCLASVLLTAFLVSYFYMTTRKRLLKDADFERHYAETRDLVRDRLMAAVPRAPRLQVNDQNEGLRVQYEDRFLFDMVKDAANQKIQLWISLNPPEGLEIVWSSGDDCFAVDDTAEPIETCIARLVNDKVGPHTLVFP